MQLIEDIIKTSEELAGIPVGSFHWSSRKQILTMEKIDAQFTRRSSLYQTLQ